MDIKHVLGALVVILLISNIFCIYEMQFSNKNSDVTKAVIGNKVVELPENYLLNNSPVFLDISNGSDTIYMYKLNKTDIDSAIKDYSGKYSENYSISTSEFNSKFNGAKTIAVQGNSTISNYWFKLDDDVYQIQVNGDSSKYDEIAKNMINSIS